MNNKIYNIYIVGVGGQGVLTIADIITNVAFAKDIPANYYPTKGMAQRGGFVKAQLRLGAEGLGPDISEQGADLIISMEKSETLKGLKYLKKGGEVFLYENRWEPTAVMLGKAPYPESDDICNEINKAGGKVRLLSNKNLPKYNGKVVRDNIYVLGAIIKSTLLNNIISKKEIIEYIKKKWPKVIDGNIFTFEEGYKAKIDVIEK